MAEAAAAPRADQPYQLLSTAKLDKNQNAHAAHRVALEMVHAHNCLLRGLNSILQQGPYIVDIRQAQNYSAEDLTDLLLYTEAWAKAMEHHHHVEEAVFFPGVQKLEGAPSGVFDDSLDQHTVVHGKLARLLEYVSSTSARPDEYKWDTMKSLIDELAPALYQHLTDEIDALLTLQDCDSQAIWQCFEETEKAATAAANLELFYNVFPALLGGSDKTFEGGNNWPALPFFMPYAIHYWFSRRRRGAWRFCPCDFFGKPRALQMVPQSRAR